ncbi:MULTISPECIES: hypothetical protein [unclassified Campylobacter]|uniref:hypothetical protein n=1 Tax=unclassified Campylobacter TaxID=2593542 RepID=UPI0022E9CED6|nr:MULTISPECIES: hypothetical protein [unclassified Campylobacter]MDA3050471.1 hypothetical protein [Campylobacter sp. JMF_02 ED1]MDA3055064.1 hypothetical protein [Campylobacter sp. VBCF_07 NA4]MDA3057770.1 hypothetical protein [Campylobacter sp. VBCF_04 NA7]MDA3058856.1 hypothetical protein [Campylobacter sp. VBCF_05 NA6]MDA3060566.1 hypothetical protein [Campylobacter sp. VBCF_02 NA5]
MGLFKAKSFLSVAQNDSECEFVFRKLGFSKKIVDEKTLKFSVDSATDFAAQMAEFRQGIAKSLHANILIDDPAQRVIFSSEPKRTDECFYQSVDSDFTVEFPRSATTGSDEKFGASFNSYESLFKVLYFLYKNQHEIDSVAMFVLKFNDRVAFLVANKKRALYADMILIDDEMKGMMSDSDELFYEILNFQIDNFYQSKNSEFLTNVFIYSDGTLSNEIGYVIFTRIHIKTNLINLNFADFINKIAMVEARN